MAFRASNVVPQRAYEQVKQAAVNLKGTLQNANSVMSSESVGYDFLYRVQQALSNANAQFNALKTAPGLSDYAQSQENDPAYDVAAEFTAMQGAIASALTWMDTNVPTSVTVASPSGWSTPNVITNTFAPAATAGFRATLQSVIDTIS